MRYKDDIETRLTGRHKKAMRLSGDVRDKVILNIGCSIGWYEQFTTRQNCKLIVGIDTDARALARARELVNRAEFILCSALKLPFEDSYFDMVTMFDVIEHVEKNTEINCLAEINRVLKSNGTLILSTPNNKFFAKILDPAWYFGHRHYSTARLQELLAQSGFRVYSIEYGGGFYELVSMILLYLFKWIFRMEIPFKRWFDRKRDREYLEDKGFATLFIKARK